MLNRLARSIAQLSTLLAAVVLVGCQAGEDAAEAPTEAPGNVVEFSAQGLTFVGVPDEVPAGWTTFRFSNTSEMIHFALLWKMPEGQGIEAHQLEAAPVFQEGYELLVEGDIDGANETFGELPAWFGELVAMGGPGLTSPGQTSQATVQLEPGTYVMECYIKTGGIFHSYNPDPDTYGMVAEFEAVEMEVSGEEPEPTLEVMITAEDGFRIQGSPTPGEHTVQVTFLDQATYPNFAGHDLHVVHLSPEVDTDELESWMDWTNEAGMAAPAPATFIGGINELPVGEVGYFGLTLEAGESYAFIAEVPDPGEKGMMGVITVPEG